jgi:hypothetical protein
MTLTQYVARVRKIRHACNIPVENPGGMSHHLRICSRFWQDNIVVDLTKILRDNANWIQLSHDKDQWWGRLVKNVLNFHVS